MFAGCKLFTIASRFLYAISEAGGLDRPMAAWVGAKTRALWRYLWDLGSEACLPRTGEDVFVLAMLIYLLLDDETSLTIYCAHKDLFLGLL